MPPIKPTRSKQRRRVRLDIWVGTSRDEILEQLLQYAGADDGAIIDAKTAENAAGMTAIKTISKVINDLDNPA